MNLTLFRVSAVGSLAINSRRRITEYPEKVTNTGGDFRFQGLCWFCTGTPAEMCQQEQNGRT
jgi:hypothetical protein